tara:strand:+ start:1295 stop:3592 length:2298 start_codon:yes stop_codon:yes gene_type:complete
MGYDKIPRQKLPISKKTKKWQEACVEAYIELSNSGRSSGSNRKESLQQLYEYYNGVIDEADYKYVLKPYGKSRSNFPSQMRNYPIIKPIVDLLLGEKSKRPLNFTVTVQNADTVSTKEQAKQDLIYQSFQKQFVNEMIKSGKFQGEQQSVELPQHIAEQFEASYVDNRAIKGQQALDYIMHSQEIHDKFQKAWFHFLVSGECYTHRGVRNNEPFYEILNPLDVDYDLDPDLDFVEDGDWAIVRKYVHASSVIDAYYEYLSEQQILELEEPRHSESDSYFLYTNSMNKDANAYRNRLIEVATVYWKSRKRIGFLNFIDPQTGAMEEKVVEDGFRMPNELRATGAKLEWKWVNEVWEGTRIDGRMYIKTHPIVNQRNSLDNHSTCKLPINGIRYSNVNTSNISLVKLGIPYQLNYNIYKYRLELAIARSKDIIAQFDINMIPKKWDMDKFMYYVEGTGIAWVDYNKEGIQLNPQHQAVMDMSIKTIEQYIALLESIMQEWEKLSGVNRQRQGQVGSYEGKATSQQAIVQSSHITEDYFRKFNRMEQRDLQSLIDYSKEAWLTGKKTMYMMADGTTDWLDLNSLEHMEAEYGIFVSDSGKEQDKLEAIKQLSQSMVQNGVPASTIAEMFDSSSFTQIKHKIKLAEQAQQKLAQQQQEAQQQMQQAELEQKAKEAEDENMNKEKDRETQIKVAMIHARDNDTNAQLNLAKGMRELDIKEREVDIKAREAEGKEKSTRDTADIKKEDIRSKERMARLKAAVDRKKKSSDK